MGTPEHRQDRDLAHRAGQGEEAAWREIYEATCQPLFNFLCFQVGDRETARDLLQETYLRALSRLDGYRGEGPLLAWLRRIALSRALDWRRVWHGRLRRLVTLTPAVEATAAAPADPAAADARLSLRGQAFQAALQRLTAKQRACLILRELEELPFGDVAREVGCSEATARVHHHRAKLKLRQWLAAPADEMGGQQA